MKKIFSILICAGLCTCLLAGPADPRPQQFTQPDGSTVTVYLYGDEYLNWMTDESGDVVEVGEDGFLRRGEMPSRELITKASFRRQNANIGLRSGTQTGTRHFLVVLVDYPDCPFITTKEQFEDFFNGSGAGSTDSVRNYYIEQSDGQFTPEFDIFGPVTVSNNRATYKENAKGALSEAIGQLVNADTDPLNLGNYISSSWSNLEYYIDDVVMIFAGHSRASGDKDGIWPSQQTVDVYNKGKNYVKSFCCAPELQGKSGNTMAGIGHICHEFGHCMGLPDFYADDFTHACLDFSLMGSGSYNNNSRTPPPLSIIEREICGWANAESDIQTISSSGNLTLHEIGQDASNTRAYAIPTDKEGEVFICEYRSLVQNKWSAGLARGGMLVYHMDKSDRNITQGEYTETAADWWKYGTINHSNHPLFYLIPSGDQTNIKASDKNIIPFPGSRNVIMYNPVSWNNITSYVSLSGLSYNGNNTSMTIKAHVRSFPLINNPGKGAYSAGDSFALTLSPGTAGTESVTKWYFDGNETGESSVTLTAGDHVIEALLSSGKKIRLEIKAQ